jgi:hypothetical protein
MSLQQMYERYSGFYQGHPLSEEETKYDDTCRKIYELEQVVRGKSMALFTAHEFLWFSWFVNKNFIGQNQDRLDDHLKSLTDILDALNQREVEK